MEPKTSKTYKRRLITIAILIFIAAFLSTFLGKIVSEALLPTSNALDESIQTLQSTTDEEYKKIIEEQHPDVSNDSDLNDRQKTLDAFLNLQEQADSNLFKYGEAGISLSFYIALSGIFIGTMILVMIIRAIMFKIWKDLKLWITIVFPVVFILLLLIINIGFYLIYITYLGMIGQIPLLIYTIYKYIKLKKEEDKDDIIVKTDTNVKKEETKED